MIVTKDVVFNERGNMQSQIRRLDANLAKVFQALQGRITFGDNVAGQFVTIADTGSADTEFEVNHDLGAVPVGFIVVNQDKAGSIYDSGTAWTTSKVFLKASVANMEIKVWVIK